MNANGNLDTTEMIHMEVNTSELVIIDEHHWHITRVPSGWIYSNQMGHTVFVPEFIPYQIQ